MTHRRTPTEMLFVWFISISVSIICLAIIGVTATFWWPYEPVTSMEIAVLNEPHPGGILLARIDYCKPHEASPVTVRWTLVNDIIVVIDDSPAALPAGCHVTSRVFNLSPEVPPGRYRLQVEGVYEPWPWRRVGYLRRTGVFEVTR